MYADIIAQSAVFCNLFSFFFALRRFFFIPVKIDILPAIVYNESRTDKACP